MLETLRTRTIKDIQIHLIDKEKAIVPLKAKKSVPFVIV